MGRAAKITIDLNAQSAALKKGFAEARGEVQNFGSGISRASVAGAAKFAAAAGAIGAAILIIKKSVDATVEAFNRLSTESATAKSLAITADQLRILNFAAEQTGASAEIVQAALRTMTKGVGEAAVGSGEAANALTELGLSAAKLRDISADQQFATIGDALTTVGNTTDRARLAMKIFGEGATQLLPLLSGGSAALNAYGADAQNMGLLLGNSREAVEAGSAALKRMRAAWGAVWEHLAAFIAPALEWVAKLLGTITGAIARFTGDVTGTVGKMKAFGTATEGVKAGFSAVGDAAAAAAAKSKAALEGLAEAAKARGKEIAQSLRTPFQIFVDSLKELRDLFAGGAISQETLRRAVAKSKSDLAGTFGAADSFQTPAIAAMTRNTMAGYSAVQNQQRQRQDEERRHAEDLEASRRIEAAIRETGLVLSPVRL